MKNLKSVPWSISISRRELGVRGMAQTFIKFKFVKLTKKSQVHLYSLQDKQSKQVLKKLNGCLVE